MVIFLSNSMFITKRRLKLLPLIRLAGQGYYLFIETSVPRRVNDTARLLSPLFPAQAGSSCLRFWYHMYGAHVNRLNVDVVMGSTKQVVWTKQGSQTNRWHQAVVSITGIQAFKVRFYI